MASISNTGKTMTVAFSVEEKTLLEQRGGDDWLWQVPEFTIDPSGVGRLALRPDMHTGRKVGRMTKNGEIPERWMLVIPSNTLPLAPYFNKVQSAETILTDEDRGMSFLLPKELPALSERKARIAKLGTPPKQRVRTTPTPPPAPAAVAPKAEAPGTSLVVPQPQQRGTSNLTMLIEGRSFRFEAPIEERLRVMSILAPFAVHKD